MSDAVKTGRGAKKAKARGSPRSRVDKDVQFLYAFINVMVDKADWTAVANELGISKNAARKRWLRIKARCATTATSDKKYEDEDDDDEMEDIEEDIKEGN
ncbi:uncharacterized protein N7484_009748 [Penicillium longicatenatum]|uniref:uncharacterized protein n=1 Tax=Penicillium longicatenatum TaxID=1561947 RepID=UPI0025493469|nr:uncharacterized protein N7484_009748 [Penicillium longicatenatum]KAJ5636435.1 hypothetical protein N7484_009748 [Penicillium longicatenatum]